MENLFLNNDTVSWDHSRGILTVKDNLNKQSIKISEEAILMLAERIREGSIELGIDSKVEASSPYGEYSHELTINEIPSFTHNIWTPIAQMEDELRSNGIILPDNWQGVPATMSVNFPKTAGRYYLSDNFSVDIAVKPSWLHRFMTKLLLGWEWRDHE